MIEKPLINKYMCSSKDNRLDVLRRIRHHVGREMNPRNKLSVTKEQYKQYFKFTFVRNPWARAYSWYKNVMRDEIHRRRHGIADDMSLKVFLQKYAGRGMLRPQTYWITSFDGSVYLDYIGRFDTLQSDFEYVCRRLHIASPALPHKVSGTGEDYRRYFDKDSIALISKVYRSDIEMFGYTFES